MRRFFLFVFFPESSFRKKVEDQRISRTKIIYCIAINVIFPLIFLISGLIIHNNTSLKEQIQETLDTSLTEKIDDYARYAPIPFVYALDFMGLKPASSIIKRTDVIALSFIVSDFVVHRTKKATNATRPNGEERSFPSQHTNQAFLGATILHHEYIGSSTSVSVAGYACATAVGMLRVARDKHWSSDALVGAAVGMITTNMVYLFIYALLYRFVRTLWEKGKRLFVRNR